MTIATRVGLSELSRKHFKDVSLDSTTASDNLSWTDDGSSVGDQLHQKRILEVLKTLIENRLTDKQREATQGLLDGIPVEEFARRTGSNRNAVYKLIHDARVSLRDGFTENGITTEDVNSAYV